MPDLEFVRAAHIDGLVCLRFGYQRERFAWVHETYTFALAFEGVARWTYRRKQHVGHPGALSMMQPGEVHVAEIDSQQGVAILIAPNALAAALPSWTRLPNLRTVQSNRGQPDDRRFRRLYDAVVEDAPAIVQKSLFAECVAELAAHHFEVSGAPVRPGALSRAALERARVRLHDELSAPLTLDELASTAGSRVESFVRAFRGAYGMPPHAYLMHLRVHHARRLLAAGRSSADAACASGFYDQSHLTRWFRRTLGMTPRACARALSARVPSREHAVRGSRMLAHERPPTEVLGRMRTA